MIINYKMFDFNSLKDMKFDEIYKVASFFEPSDGKARLEYLEKDNRKIYKIVKDHGSKQALDLLHEKIRPESEKSPSEWLYLIDGYDEDNSIMLPEVTYAYVLGKKLSIPMEDTVISPYSKQCVDYVVFSTNLKEFDMHLAIIIDMYAYQKENTLDFINDRCGIKMEKNYYNGCLAYLNQLANQGQFENTKEYTKLLSGKLYDASRMFSRKKINTIIQKHNKEKILFVTDEGHKDIIA